MLATDTCSNTRVFVISPLVGGSTTTTTTTTTSTHGPDTYRASSSSSRRKLQIPRPFSLPCHFKLFSERISGLDSESWPPLPVSRLSHVSSLRSEMDVLNLYQWYGRLAAHHSLGKGASSGGTDRKNKLFTIQMRTRTSFRS